MRESTSCRIRYVNAAHNLKEDILSHTGKQDCTRYTMNAIRRDAVDMLLLDGLTRRHPFDHPVLWLDNDITQLSTNYTEQMTSYLQIGSDTWQTCVLSDARFSLPKVDEYDDAYKLAALNELVARDTHRHNPRSIEAIYPEESSFGMALGVQVFDWSHRLDVGHVGESRDKLLKIGSVEHLLRSALEKIDASIHLQPLIERDLQCPTYDPYKYGVGIHQHASAAKVAFDAEKHITTAKTIINWSNQYSDADTLHKAMRALGSDGFRFARDFSYHDLGDEIRKEEGQQSLSVLKPKEATREAVYVKRHLARTVLQTIFKKAPQLYATPEEGQARIQQILKRYGYDGTIY